MDYLGTKESGTDFATQADISAASLPTYVTSLPGSPTDGQRIFYAADAANSVIWHMRYRSAARSGSGAWEFLGGPSMLSGPSGSMTTASTSWTALTSGPSLTVPRQGIYRVVCDLYAIYTRVGPDLTFGGQSIQAGVSANAAAPEIFFVSIFIDNFEAETMTATKTVTYATSDALTIRVKNDQASEEVTYERGAIQIHPVYVY